MPKVTRVEALVAIATIVAIVALAITGFLGYAFALGIILVIAVLGKFYEKHMTIGFPERGEQGQSYSASLGASRQDGTTHRNH